MYRRVLYNWFLLTYRGYHSIGNDFDRTYIHVVAVNAKKGENCRVPHDVLLIKITSTVDIIV